VKHCVYALVAWLFNFLAPSCHSETNHTHVMIRFIGWWFLQTWLGARLDLSDEQRLQLLQQEIKKSKATYHPKDSVFIDDEDTLRLSLRSQRESFGQGCDAVLQMAS